ncbi:MAG: ABC transporter substrate-binding protein [Synergistales bacterium]|nr:ABC transporter substrate-binding protein [Synergistales bacterium]
MKRLVAVALCGLMVVGLVSGIAGAATLEEIKDRGVIKVGHYMAAGFCEERENGELYGLDVELGVLIAEKIGVECEHVVQETWTGGVARAWDPGYDWSDFDIVAADITVTDERGKHCTFSEWYFMTGQTVLVPEGSSITSPMDIGGHSIATVEGTTCEEAALSVANKSDLVYVPTPKAVVEAVAGGEAECGVYDEAMLKMLTRDVPGLKILPGRLTKERYAVAMPQNTPDLLAVVNEVVTDNRVRLYQKYFD